MSTGFADACSCSSNDRRATIEFVFRHLTSLSSANCQGPSVRNKAVGTSKNQSSLHPVWLLTFLLPPKTSPHTYMFTARNRPLCPGRWCQRPDVPPVAHGL